MSCKCARRMRGILRKRGFKLIDGWWVRREYRYEDKRIEDHHKEIVKKWFLGEAKKIVHDFFDGLGLSS